MQDGHEVYEQQTADSGGKERFRRRRMMSLAGPARVVAGAAGGVVASRFALSETRAMCFCLFGSLMLLFRATFPLAPLVCPSSPSVSGKICKIDIHNMTIMRTHYEAKHPAVTLNEADYAEA